MKEPIIVNESPSPLDPGCIYIFTSLPIAERYFEPWYVDESYYACDSEGVRLRLLPNEDTGGVTIVEWGDEVANPRLSASFLRAYIGSLSQKHGWEKIGKSEEWLHTATNAAMAELALEYATE